MKRKRAALILAAVVGTFSGAAGCAGQESLPEYDPYAYFWEGGIVQNETVVLSEQDDGSISVGDYDMVPWIDTFVKEHPDFSYHGHKGIIALTGYEGVLGYRTDEVYRTREAGRVTEYQQKFFDEHPDFDEAARL